MNKKGQNVNLMIGVFISVIVGLVLFQVIAQNVGGSTNTVAVVNESLGVITNGTDIYLTNYRAISDVVIYNTTGNVIIAAGNYTITNNALDTNNALSVAVNGNASTKFNTWSISGTGQPVTYISDSGSRSVAALIVIFFALMILAVAMTPVLREKMLDMMK